MTYQTAAELRRANLRTLVAERGGQRELADLVGVAPAQISQWPTAARDAKTGTPRTISDESARRLEDLRGCSASAVHGGCGEGLATVATAAVVVRARPRRVRT